VIAATTGVMCNGKGPEESFLHIPLIDLIEMNWESERDMAKDVEENKELYEALAATPEDEE
jgi:hypothetical protein